MQMQEFLKEGEDPLELTIEIEELRYGKNVTALLVYTGNLAKVETREVIQAFIEMQCQNKFQVEASQIKKGSSNSSMKSFGSNKSGSASGSKPRSKNQGNEYLRAIMTNVFTVCGYKHFVKYLKRQGKSKLSMSNLVKQLQVKFTPEEWYYLRKIHKKQNNFFLNQNRQLGEVGGGWIELSSKTSKSGLSSLSQKSNCACQQIGEATEESKTHCLQCKPNKNSRKHNISAQTRARSFSDGSNNSFHSKDDHRTPADFDMKMIDEVENELEGDDNGSDNPKKDPRDLVDQAMKDADQDFNIDEDTGFFSQEWILVNDRNRKKRQ